MLKKTILFTILGVILISFLSLVIFYAVSFEKINTTIAYINKNGSSNSEETDWISISDFKKLQIVDDVFITEDNYINIKTKNNVKFKSLDNIVYTVDVKAVVNDWETSSNVAECSGKLKIDFKFSGMKWQVVKVEREQ